MLTSSSLIICFNSVGRFLFDKFDITGKYLGHNITDFETRYLIAKDNSLNHIIQNYSDGYIINCYKCVKHINKYTENIITYNYKIASKILSFSMNKHNVLFLTQMEFIRYDISDDKLALISNYPNLENIKMIIEYDKNFIQISDDHIYYHHPSEPLKCLRIKMMDGIKSAKLNAWKRSI